MQARLVNGEVDSATASTDRGRWIPRRAGRTGPLSDRTPSLPVRLASVYVGVAEQGPMGYGDAFGNDGLVTAWGLLAATSMVMVLLWTAGASTDGPARTVGDHAPGDLAVGGVVGGVGAVLLPTVALVLLLVVALVAVHRAAP